MRITTPKPKFTPPAQLNFLKRKEMNYDSRKLLIKHYWDDVQTEYTEANQPTNIYNMFCEMLESMPKDIISGCETQGLFKDALETVIGKEATKSKKYI